MNHNKKLDHLFYLPKNNRSVTVGDKIVLIDNGNAISKGDVPIIFVVTHVRGTDFGVITHHGINMGNNNHLKFAFVKKQGANK